MIKIVHLPDFHFGHGKVPAILEREHLIKYCYPILNDSVDLVVVGGDFYDNLLSFNSQNGFTTATVINELKELAKYHKFYIRILRGTYTHDRSQNQFFNLDSGGVAPQLHNTPQWLIFDKLSVDTIPHLQLTSLYIPDDLGISDVDNAVNEVLQTHHLKGFDLVVTHGYYDHLLPPSIPNRPAGTYTTKQFDKIANLVLNGHIHTSSIRGKVITGGSFERLGHGEEEAKGFFVINYDPPKFTYDFIINEDTLTFITYNYAKTPMTQKVIDDFRTKVEGLIATNKSGSIVHIRVVTDDHVLRQSLSGATLDLGAQIKLTFKRADQQSVNIENTKPVFDDLPVLTEANLHQHVGEFLELTSEEDLLKIKDILNTKVR